MEGEGGGEMYFKAAPAGNSRLGYSDVSVSRTNRFCTRENPFGPKSVIIYLFFVQANSDTWLWAA